MMYFVNIVCQKMAHGAKNKYQRYYITNIRLNSYNFFICIVSFNTLESIDFITLCVQ